MEETTSLLCPEPSTFILAGDAAQPPAIAPAEDKGDSSPPASSLQQPGVTANPDLSSDASTEEPSSSAPTINQSLQSPENAAGDAPPALTADMALSDPTGESAHNVPALQSLIPLNHTPHQHSAKELTSDSATPESPTQPESATPSKTLPVATDHEGTPPITTPPATRKKAMPGPSEEEEEEVAPTRLLRSAVKRVKEPVSSKGAEEREELVVSWSLKLVRSAEGEVKGELWN